MSGYGNDRLLKPKLPDLPSCGNAVENRHFHIHHDNIELLTLLCRFEKPLNACLPVAFQGYFGPGIYQ